MPLILGTNSIKDTGYEVANSLRLESGSSDNLTRSQTSGNRNKATFSAWVKRSKLGANQGIFGIHGASSDAGQIEIRFQSSGEGFHISGQATNWRRTNRHFRDVSAWHHLVVAFDTTLSTASDRVKVYVNGVQETSFAASGDPSQDSDLPFGLSGATCSIGSNFNAGSAGEYFSGYLAEVVLIDGQQLDPTSFGEFDEDSPTIWKPKDVSGLTFGTNGFYLDFENASSLGADVSGNSNNFTVNNLTSIDQTTDTCTNNFATMNPLYNFTNNATLSEGNLKVVGGSAWNSVGSTIGLTSGKWYYEVKMTSLPGGGSNGRTGFFDSEVNVSSGNIFSQTNGTTYYYNEDGGEMIKDNSTTTNDYGVIAQGSILGVALNMDDKQVTFYDDNSAIITNYAISTNIDIAIPSSSVYNETQEYNFGNPPYSLTSGESDQNGYGSFEFSPPSGYYSICTKNLAEYG